MLRITSAILLLLVSSSTSFTIQSRVQSRLAAPRIQYKTSALKDFTNHDTDHHQSATLTTDSKDNDAAALEQDAWDQNMKMVELFHQIEQEKLVVATPPPPDQDVWNARFLLLAAAALYGTNFSVVKLLGEVMPVGAMGTMRFGLAALATMPWLLAKPKENSNASITLAAAVAGFEVGMWNSVGYVAQAVGLETTSASKSAFLCSLAVVIVPLIDRAMGKKLTAKQIVGAAMAVLGVAFLELGGGPIESLSSGDIASLLQPFAFGMGFWKMEQLMRAHPGEASRSTAAQLLAIFCASAAYCVGGHTVPDMDQVVKWVSDPMILAALVWTGAVTTALTVYMETLALKTLSAADTTLIFSTEPLWGAAFAAVVMGEQFGNAAIAGGALIVTGCLVSNLGIDGLRRIVDSPQVSENPIGRLVRSGLAGALGGWVTSLAPGVAMVESTELEGVEEVVTKVTDIMSDVL
jgi:drug/metabolite transporter (DMT)-like permease